MRRAAASLDLGGGGQAVLFARKACNIPQGAPADFVRSALVASFTLAVSWQSPQLRQHIRRAGRMALGDTQDRERGEEGFSQPLSVLGFTPHATTAQPNGYLAELAQTIYNDWFRDFGHWGGQMPSHWETRVLDDYVTVKRGGLPRPIQEYLSDEGLRWLKIADVSGISGPYILEIKEHIKEEGLRKTVHLEPGSLVLSNSATPGIPKILSIDTCIHDGWLYFPQSQFTNEWLYCYLDKSSYEWRMVAFSKILKRIS